MHPHELAAAVGKGLRAFREAKRVRQNDVALAARQTGLAWTRSIVMALEDGRRYLTIDEFARLPLILERLGVERGAALVRLENLGNFAQIRVGGLLGNPDDRQLGLPLSTQLSPAMERVARARHALPGGRFLDV